MKTNFAAFIAILIILMICLSSIPAAADTWQESVDAYNAGDFARWIEITRQLALRGDATARCIIGEAYRTGNHVEKNLEEAFKWFRMAADQGNADAWLSLGFAWDNGEGIPRNYAEAYYCYYIACKTRPQAKKFLDRVAWKLSAQQRHEIRTRADNALANSAAGQPPQSPHSENTAQ